MLKIVVTYFTTLLFFLLIDGVWLWLVALPMFRATLGENMLTFRAAPGVLFYILYVGGISIFVIPTAEGGGWPMTLLFGGLFGLFAYSTYDLTNYATLKPWTFKLAATDIVWGMVLTAIVSVLGSLAGQALFSRLHN